MVRPTRSFGPLIPGFDENMTLEEPGPSRAPAAPHRHSGLPPRTYQPSRRYGKGGRSRQASARPPPEYVRGVEDWYHSPVSSESESLHDRSDSGSGNGGVGLIGLPPYGPRHNARPRSSALLEADRSRNAAVAGPPTRVAKWQRPERDRQQEEGAEAEAEERLIRTAARIAPAQARAMNEMAHPAMLSENQRERLDQMCPCCVEARRREILLWGFVRDSNASLVRLEERFSRLWRVTDEMIGYLKQHGFTERME